MTNLTQRNKIFRAISIAHINKFPARNDMMNMQAALLLAAGLACMIIAFPNPFSDSSPMRAVWVWSAITALIIWVSVSDHRERLSCRLTFLRTILRSAQLYLRAIDSIWRLAYSTKQCNRSLFLAPFTFTLMITEMFASINPRRKQIKWLTAISAGCLHLIDWAVSELAGLICVYTRNFAARAFPAMMISRLVNGIAHWATAEFHSFFSPVFGNCGLGTWARAIPGTFYFGRYDRVWFLTKLANLIHVLSRSNYNTQRIAVSGYSPAENCPDCLLNSTAWNSLNIPIEGAPS